jgi:hypothetical protein
MSTLERAIEIAVRAHEGQCDKAGAPYVLRPLRLKMTTDEQRIAAVLHDVVEDCAGWKFERLRGEGFAPAALEALNALTKRPGESGGDARERRAYGRSLSPRCTRSVSIDYFDVLKLSQWSDDVAPCRTRFEGPVHWALL